jgi:hypothetical protein
VQAFALAIDRKPLGGREYSVSQANITGFPKTGIFSIAIIVLVLLGKSNAAAGFAVGTNRVFAAGTRSHFGTHTIYTESKINLFRMFASTLGGYDRKEGRI